MKTLYSFNWDIHWVCNYNCPYCWFYDKWAQLKEKNRLFPPETIIEKWEKIFELYGRSRISITGGEPFIYPDFVKIIKNISKMHEIEIITNLSCDPGRLAEEIRGRGVTINPSFHPLSADIGTFMERAAVLMNNDLLKAVSIVAWPPIIKDIPRYREYFMRQRALFKEHSAGVSIQPFNGTYGGRQYPKDYSEEELRIINESIGQRGGKEFSVKPPIPKGRLCNAGRSYGVIQPDGTFQRCGSIGQRECNMGNFFDPGFILLENPMPCTSNSCICNEWVFLLQE